MLLAGPLGVYFFSLAFIKGEDSTSKKSASFIAGLFYLFNLSTVQLFYSNFDGFVTHYGFIPWLFLTSYLFLIKGEKKHLLYFLLISLVSANQAYTGTLFFAFALFLSTFLFIVFLQNKRVIPVKRLVSLLILWVGINSFWMLPVGYFISTSSDVVPNASINLMSSEESYFMNKKYGKIGDVLTLKNFWFDLNDYDNYREDFVPLLEPWINYLDGKVFILYIFSFLIVAGFLFCLLKKQYRPMAFLFLMSIFFLMAGNGILGGLFEFFQKNIPLFKEALRFPFTKFSVLASFVYAFLIGVLIREVLFFSKNILKNSISSLLLVVVMVSSLTYVFFPYFEGKLINSRMRVSLPEDYSQVYDFFDTRPKDERIYLMPSNTFWAWEYYDWGYRGSGFVWYGLKQPVLARAFDVWNRTNEKVYWEVSYALASRDGDILNDVLDKYNIKWLIYDGSRIYPKNDYITDYSLETKEYLDTLLDTGSVINSSQTLGFLTLYETKVDSPVIEHSVSEVPKVTSFRGVAHFDPAYLEIGDYISNDPAASQIVFPYSNLSSARSISLDSESIISRLSEGYERTVFDRSEFSIPYTAILETDGSGIKVSIDSSGGEREGILFQENLSLDMEDSILFLENHYKVKDIISEPKKGLLTVGRESNYLRVYQTKSLMPLEFFAPSRPELSTCSDIESGPYLIEYRDSSFYLESYADNISVCMYTGLSIKPDSRYLRVLNLTFNSRDSVGRVCFLDREIEKCVYSQNFFGSGEYSVPLLNLKEGKEYAIYFYSYPSSDVSVFLNSYSAEFSNIYIEDKELILEKEIEIPDLVFSDLETSLDIDLKDFENKTYFYTDKELVKLFRSCKEGGDNMSFANKDGNLVFPIPSEKNLCLTILTDSMLPYLPYSGMIEIEYEVSEKSQNVYAVKDSLLSAVDRFEKDNHTDKLNFSFFDAGSLSINVELTSPGSEDNFLKIKSVKVVPFDVRGVAFSEINSWNGEENMLYSEPLDYKGTNYVYKIKDVEKGNVIFNQTYSKDWVLICSNFKCDSTHYEMNGWQNVWVLKEASKNVYIIFVPQILGFLGILLTFTSIFYTSFILKKK
jgi:hypothetical protein